MRFLMRGFALTTGRRPKVEQRAERDAAQSLSDRGATFATHGPYPVTRKKRAEFFLHRELRAAPRVRISFVRAHLFPRQSRANELAWRRRSDWRALRYTQSLYRICCRVQLEKDCPLR
jgi:hypothetical protein